MPFAPPRQRSSIALVSLPSIHSIRPSRRPAALRPSIAPPQSERSPSQIYNTTHRAQLQSMPTQPAHHERLANKQPLRQQRRFVHPQLIAKKPVARREREIKSLESAKCRKKRVVLSPKRLVCPRRNMPCRDGLPAAPRQMTICNVGYTTVVQQAEINAIPESLCL